MTPTLAGLVIAQNEEGRIGACVRSLDFCDEVIVIDGGSNDATAARAREAGARVVGNPWPGFAEQRVFALAQTRTEWILFLDADETIPRDLAEEIRAVLASGAGPAADGFRIPRSSLFLGRRMRWGAWRNDAPLRLARRAHVRIPPRRIHERLEVQGSVAALGNFMLHEGHPDFASVAEKFRAYLGPSVDEIIAARPRGRVERSEVLLRPIASFLRDIVLRLGILDGWRGWVLAAWNAASVLARYAEARRRYEDS